MNRDPLSSRLLAHPSRHRVPVTDLERVIRASRSNQTMKNLLFTVILLCAAQALRADETPMLGLDPGDVTKASVVLEATHSATLELELTPSKQAEFTRFTNDNSNKQVSVGFSSVLASRPVLKGTP